MALFNYKKMSRTASKLLNRFGGQVTIQRTIQGQYNPATGRSESETQVEWQSFALKTGISENYLNSKNYLASQGGSSEGGRIEGGDMMVLIDVLGQENMPETGDFIVFSDGETWKITQSLPIKPGDETILFKGIIHKR